MKIRNLRWFIVMLMAFGVVLNYIDRNALAVAASTIKQDLNITTQQYSYIIATFQACYAIMQPIAGIVIDSLGVKIGLAIFAIAWSVISLAHGFTHGWLSLAFLRGALGLSESAIIPSGVKAVQEWFPARERSIATGWFNVGTSLGGAVAPPVMVVLILSYNWRIAFFIIGSLGILWSLAFFLLYRKPEQASALTEDEKNYILAGQEPDKRLDYPKPSWKDILTCRQWWALAIPRFLAEPAQGTYNFWIPLYLMTVRGLDIKQVAMTAWVPFVCADLGCIVGGYLAPFYQRIFRISLITSRKLVVCTAAVLMTAPAFIGMADNIIVVVMLLGMVGFAHQMLVVGGILPLNTDVFGHKEVATASGLNGGLGWLGTTLFTLVVGALVTTIGYNPMFISIACFDVLAAIILWVFLKDQPANLGTNKTEGKISPIISH
ncbi:MFS transporter [Sodalis sp. dw_96]|uniref:MFS transporter n=1 Tax=Sodalis sp. dw_96 TaxID=2719794 RepID=UPI001BD54BA1|nr:MFS transporter [Sodalis sp. dw_96]